MPISRAVFVTEKRTSPPLRQEVLFYTIIRLPTDRGGSLAIENGFPLEEIAVTALPLAVFVGRKKIIKPFFRTIHLDHIIKAGRVCAVGNALGDGQHPFDLPHGRKQFSELSRHAPPIDAFFKFHDDIMFHILELP